VSNANINSWSIDRIQCSDWSQPGGIADIWASNWANDEISFSISRHPDGFSALYNIEIKFYSLELSPYQGQEIIEELLIEEVELSLKSWWQKVEKLRKRLLSLQANLIKGLPADDVFYAAIASLYELRTQMQPLYVNQLLAQDLSVPLTTIKERVRKARDKDLLTSPGKGMNGQGKKTTKATKILRKAGIEVE
jgi:hypothetical protein